MEKENPDKLQKLSDFVKPIFIKWEKLRPVYNTCLLVVLLVINLFPGFIGTFSPIIVLIWLIGAVIANILYLAGPTAEAYIAWLGLRSNVVTAVLFVGGLLISVPCVIFFVYPFFPVM
jgi:hypothetical protein